LPLDYSASFAWLIRRSIVAVLIIAENKGQTQQGYDGMIAALGDLIKQAPGLILHTGHPTEDGWRVVEVWQSKMEANQWFAKYVAPNLPPGIRPKRSFYELHTLLTPEAVALALEGAAPRMPS
jgi:hypothetical protein